MHPLGLSYLSFHGGFYKTLFRGFPAWDFPMEGFVKHHVGEYQGVSKAPLGYFVKYTLGG